MAYGEIKIDTITFTAGGSDTSISVSGLVQNPTFTGNITTTGTISGDVIRGNTVSGVTVTGGTGQFAGAITASGFIPNGTGVLTNGLYSPDTNQVALSTNSVNRFTVTESGVFLFATGVVATGVTDKIGTDKFIPKIQLAGQGSKLDTALSLLHYSSAGFYPQIVLGTSNSNTFGEYTDTQSGRVYGEILFETANETNDRFGPGAAIRGFADYTPVAGVNGVPGALSFFTGTEGIVGNIERMRIASSGYVGIGNYSNNHPDALLELRGNPNIGVTPEIFISNIGEVASGNTSSTITFRGGGTGSETNIARFTVIADGNDENGAHLAFATTASGGSLTERLRIQGGGNVGIGTTSPGSTLTVKSPGASNTFIDALNSGNTSIFSLTQSSGGSGQLKLADSVGTTFLTADAAANRVGIGTTSPDSLLHLRNTGGDVRHTLESADGSQAYTNYSAQSSEFAIGYVRVSGSDTSFRFCAAGDLTSNERMRIDGSGRLLVGTSSYTGNGTIVAQGHSGDSNGPAHVLLKRGNTSPTSDGDLGYLFFSDGNSSGGFASWILGQRDGGTWNSGSSMPGRLVFSTTADGQSSPDPRMTIDSAGDITIGNNTSLGYRLGLVVASGADRNLLIAGISGVSNGLQVNYINTGTALSVKFHSITTTASAANAFLDSADGNRIYRSTSSLRYKKDVEDIDQLKADAVLSLRPVWYRSKAADDRSDWSWYGLIAEEVAAIEPRLVHWTYLDEDYDVEEIDGSIKKTPKPDAQLVPDGVQYDRLTVLLLDVVKRQNKRIETLEAKVAALEAS